MYFSKTDHLFALNIRSVWAERIICFDETDYLFACRATPFAQKGVAISPNG